MSTSVRLTAAGVTAGCLMGLVAIAPGASAAYDVEPGAPGAARPVEGARAGRDAQSVLDRMSLRQKVGQLFMVGTPAVGPHAATLTQITRRHVGNIMLTGRSHDGTSAPARAARAGQARATHAATHGVRLLVATDQEGGLVQVLQGRGFSRMPSALRQGTWPTTRLRNAAQKWAGQLRRAGVNMDLAPVEDTVPNPRVARSNPPIGAFDREFGFRTRLVARHGRAFLDGMSARVVPTIKHFPGLGRVHANTDTSAGVTDYVTTRHDAYLTPFARSIRAGAPAVMMSTAYYHRIDPGRPAVFSRRIVHTMLRGDLGFAGVVVSDDLGDARQVSRWGYGARAVKFIRAGGDIVLTVDPASVPAMYAAVVHRATRAPYFRHQVNAATRRILELKERRGLL